MFESFYQEWNRLVGRCPAIPDQLWSDTLAQLPVLARLDSSEQARLRRLVRHFVHRKIINGANGYVVDDAARLVIAAQACLLILNLDIKHFSGWREVIVYPGSFVVTHRRVDKVGLVCEKQSELSGEAWLHGPVILSWADVQPDLKHHRPGANVVLHEFAHKLDMLNGVANGMPPLHGNMAMRSWSEVLSEAYATLNNHLEHHQSVAVDPYAATDPAEFFAVFTEVFFEQPLILSKHFPQVYDQFRAYYRQDPLARV